MASQECLDMIRQGATAWNDWRNSQEFIYLDLSGADLSKMDLRSIDLSSAYLHMTNLSEANLSEANLCRAYLEGARLDGACLDNANLSTANLHLASLVNASLDSADLSESDLREAQMQRISAQKVIFSGANLSGADLSEATLTGAKFSKSILRDVRFSKAQLTSADLSVCDLSSLDLENVDLRDANLREADLTGVNLSGANLQRATLQDATLRGASFYGAMLDGSNLEGADLNTAYMGDARLKLARLRGADLSFVDLSGATLFLADLSNTDLTRANFTRAVLDQADFSHATLGWTIFGGVDLSTAKGLDSIYHHGALILDIETLLRSVNNLTSDFLSAANIAPDIATSLSTTLPADPYTWCICASDGDEEFAKRLHASLQRKGIRCWYALIDFQAEEKLQEHLDELIRLHDQLLLVFSQDSINSQWMRYAVEAIQRREQRETRTLLQPVSLDYALIKSQQDWVVSMLQNHALVDLSIWHDNNLYGRVVNLMLRKFRTERNLPGARTTFRHRQGGSASRKRRVRSKQQR